MKDLAIDREKNPGSALEDRWDPEEEEEYDDGDDLDIIDRCELDVSSNADFVLRNYLASLAEETGPGQYIDVTRARRHDAENINWPRPG